MMFYKSIICRVVFDRFRNRINGFSFCFLYLSYMIEKIVLLYIQ